MEIEELVQKNLIDGSTLDLENRKLGSEGAKKLAQMDVLSNVVNLELGDNDIGDEGVMALSDSPFLGQLKVLNLKSNNISALGAKALAESKIFAQLDQLILKFNDIGEEAKHLRSGTAPPTAHGAELELFLAADPSQELLLQPRICGYQGDGTGAAEGAQPGR